MRASRLIPLFSLLMLAGCSGGGLMESVDTLLGHDSEASEERLKGDRIAVLGQAKELQPDTELQGTSMALETLPVNAAWPQIYATAAGVAGNLPYAGTGESDGTATMGGGNDFADALVSPPVIAANMVIAMDGAGIVSARDAKSLDKRWVSEALHEEDTTLPGGGVAYARGRVIAANGNGHIAALDATSGKTAWEYSLNLPLRTPPRVLGTTVLVQTAEQQLFALSLADGRLLWRHRGVGETASMMAQTAPAAAGSVVVVAYGSGDMLGLSVDSGEELWASSLTLPGAAAATAAFGGFAGAPVIDSGIAYAGSANGIFAAIDTQDGQRLWELNLTVRGTPYVVGDYVFVVNMQDTLYAIQRHSGHVRWSLQLPRFANEKNQRQGYLWQGPVMAGGRLWLVSARGRILGVHAEKGEIAIDRELPDNLRHAPVIAMERMWLMDAGAKLHVLQ